MKCMRWMLVLLALAIGAGAHQPSKIEKDRAAVAFDQLKTLAGEWEGTAVENGKEISVPITFRLASGGSVLLSDLAPGTDHEMVTIFHRDGGDLLATHYCLTGNQPRMRAAPSADPNVVSFEFKDATNLPSPAAPHMAGVKLIFVDASHHIEEWTIAANGQTSIRKFDCRRKT